MGLRVGVRAGLGLFLLVLAVFAGSAETHARLQPYYLLRGTAAGQINPRVLFALDTSGSMIWRPSASNCPYSQVNRSRECDCLWNECEDTADPIRTSRIASARAAIRSVVAATDGAVDFGLMTFGSVAPPTRTSEVPSTCSSGRRFAWVTQAAAYAGRQNVYGPWGDDPPPGYSSRRRGTWALCGENRPFPYMRADEMGVSVPSSFDPDNPPAGPLFAEWGGTWSSWTSSSMARRRVQWMPAYMGAHFNVSCADVTAGDAVDRSLGDYGAAEMCGRDFFYVPYVDGFAGYPAMAGYSGTSRVRMGVHERAFNLGAGGDTCVRYTDPCCEDHCQANADFQTCTQQCDTTGVPPPPPPPPVTCPSVSSWSCSEGTGFCNCTVDGFWFDCTSNPSCWSDCKSNCQSNCGFFSFAGCARQCWESNCVGGGATDCQEVCEDRTEECISSCSGSNSCPVCDEWIAGAGNENGSLLSPFWSQGAIDRFAGLDEGPASADDANNVVMGLTAHAMYGGVGAQSGTPWSTAIGDIPYTSADPLPPGLSNAPYAHSSVASYLALMSHPDLGGSNGCSPVSLVVITDGEPSPSSEGGSGLYRRLRELRTRLDVKTYVVGFTLSSTTLNRMACAAAGGGGSDPCTGSPPTNYDTCRDPTRPGSACAYLADDTDELAAVLRDIMVDQASADIPTGQGTSVNEFVDDTGGSGTSRQAVQTAIEGFTRMPTFEGHVVRSSCTAQDFPDLSPAEVAAFCSTAEPLAIAADEAETFSSCSGSSCVCDEFSRTWDAGECLQETPWSQRRLYTSQESGGTHTLVRMINASGAITSAFSNMLRGTRAAAVGLPDMSSASERQAFAEFLAGRNWPDGWKLSGLGGSTPVVARRIPRRDAVVTPSVGIRDPHCTGRLLQPAADVPQSLQDFSEAVWDPAAITATAGFQRHRDYQEAVLVGTDLGFLHAFQLDSGNEMFAFMPPFMLANAYQMFQNGTERRGQPEAIDEVRSGVSSTVNHGWVHDASLGDWRHLAIVGMGAGGKEYVALDISHMGRLQDDDPLEVLWSTEDGSLASTYDALLGETWSRPALTYSFPGVDPLSLSSEPTSHVVFASGYPDQPATGTGQGRTVVLADALTGAIAERARIPLPADQTLLYESQAAVTNDIAVTSHCLNGLWAEMQEAYFVDPMGGLYRWDLGVQGSTRDHAADSGQRWATNVIGGEPTAVPAFRFRACQGAGASCSVDTSTGKYDSFTFGPAVAASGRFSEAPEDQTETNEFLIALVSGSTDDDAIDAGRSGNDFHSSIYLLVDDHATAPEHGGFSIPNGGDKTAGVTDPSFFRVALSDITRTRRFTPYPGATPATDTGRFSRGTRPIQPPRITMVPALGRPDITVMYLEFLVYEPGSRSCDARFYDGSSWYTDPGSTYRILFRLTSTVTGGFDFLVGSGGAFTGSDGYAPGVTGPGLSMADVQQVDGGDCGVGECGTDPGTPFAPPCDDNDYGGGSSGSHVIPLSYSELLGFTPVEG